MNIYLLKIQEISLENKYTKWYINIILKALLRGNNLKIIKNKFDYIETHHILPKSFNLGGDTDLLNLTYLTAREHFIVHMLLPKMLKDSSLKQKMAWAIVSMMGQDKKGNRNIINSSTYETAKKIFNQNNKDRPASAKALKTYKVKNPEGKIIEINNLPKFCKENDLLCYMMRHVANGNTPKHRGYTSINYEEKTRKFRDETGKIYEMTLEELKEFCKQKNLIFDPMRRLTLGSIKHHKNYFRIEDGEIKTTRKTHKLLDPNGELIVIDNLPQFCIDNGLNYSTLRSVSNGSKKKSKEGYTKFK